MTKQHTNIFTRYGKAIVAGAFILSLGACSALPQLGARGGSPSRPASTNAPASTASAATIRPTGPLRSCHADLQKSAAQFTPLPDRYLGKDCSQLGTVKLASLDLSRANSGAGKLQIGNLGPVTCPMAQRFASWSQYAVARAARQMLGSELVRIETLGSYNCRNVAGTSKRSEHAHANAIDVSAFIMADGRRITVQGGWNGSRAERAFLKTIHKSACRRFGTVLGPDFNKAHRDHFHLDMADNNGFCR